MLSAKLKDVFFKIEEDDPDIGCYLYLFKDGKCVKDHLQDSPEKCMELAYREYGVPIEIWSELIE